MSLIQLLSEESQFDIFRKGIPFPGESYRNFNHVMFTRVVRGSRVFTLEINIKMFLIPLATDEED